jgi:hypothetical protein
MTTRNITTMDGPRHFEFIFARPWRALNVFILNLQTIVFPIVWCRPLDGP